jgi:O-antigen ligase
MAPMPEQKLSLPQQWEDWASWILGFWLLLSPWVLQFEVDGTATRAAVIVGFLIILTEVVELSMFRDWEEWINVGLGACLVISPWVLGVRGLNASGNFVVIGLLVLALSIYEIRSNRNTPSNT